ncbi:hypothetical protein A2960_03395 [Candidatus Gottesmanbacteria bacterium RIFCSPLOWO2_01_FULL_39_12b]|uniref:Uncharacterized protein n=1 Tax=Candidatus Gottesmanbacteria bacterium RIFCSPLOWO2_01_FULL_39_12b TaxID=1798388 RepID=A0A1F6ANR4_9BACT|nr:MAG: hypothetical protein A2960_03395 [Candidatus Gottesmanbacteria bacterium RIFCSPLOWO2_01_FULL_39_12b]
MELAPDIDSANQVVINTCMVREMAENRVYGTVNNLVKNKLKIGKPEKIIVTGCMVGMAVRDKTGSFMKLIRKKLPHVDEFLPIEEVGFDHAPLRTNQTNAWVPISNGCNNFCTFCVVPFTRGREISRPYKEILHECYSLAGDGYKKITLLGMNVNSYGADLIVGPENIQVLRDIDKTYFNNETLRFPFDSAQDKRSGQAMKGYRLPNGQMVKPILVTHLNRLRIPTLFPYLLEDVCKIKEINEIDFMSSNPWDFSDELIEVISRNPKITRKIHFALQSGSNTVLKRMNRWYTAGEYLELLVKMRKQIPGIQFSTDIIVGFCSETEKEFAETVDLVKKAGFYKAYLAMYSDRPMTAAHKVFKDDIPHSVKKRRWSILEDLINKPSHNK